MRLVCWPLFYTNFTLIGTNLNHYSQLGKSTCTSKHAVVHNHHFRANEQA